MRRTLLTIAALALLAPAAHAQQPGYDEATNWLNSYGRTTADFQNAEKTSATIEKSANRLAAAAQDDPAAFLASGNPIYSNSAWPWNGDPARDDWGGQVEPIRFTERNGAELDGIVWAPTQEMLDGLGLAAPLPGVVINEGSLGSQPMYFWAAQGLVEAGYVVMTFDVAGQGRSERGSNSANNLRDAIDFFLSTPSAPYAHAGPDTVNPLHALLDRERIGTAGHSMGAGYVRSVGDYDGKVKAISAWSDHGSYAGNAPIQGQGADYETWILPTAPTPGVGGEGKLSGHKAAAARGVDSQEVVIEAGSHMAWSHVTWAYTSTWSETVALHYALAWFDRYLYDDIERGGKSGTERATMNLDADGEGHGLSKKYLSAYSLDDGNGGRLECGDMVGRQGC